MTSYNSKEEAIAAAGRQYEEMMASMPTVGPAENAQRVRDGEEIRSEASAFTRTQAVTLLAQAQTESLKGAANTQKIEAYRWGAGFLSEMADIIDRIDLSVPYTEAELETFRLPWTKAAEPDPHRLSPEGASEPNPRFLVDRIEATMVPVESPYTTPVSVDPSAYEGAGSGAVLETEMSKPATDEEDDPDAALEHATMEELKPLIADAVKRGRGRPPKTS